MLKVPVWYDVEVCGLLLWRVVLLVTDNSGRWTMDDGGEVEQWCWLSGEGGWCGSNEGVDHTDIRDLLWMYVTDKIGIRCHKTDVLKLSMFIYAFYSSD